MQPSTEGSTPSESSEPEALISDTESVGSVEIEDTYSKAQPKDADMEDGKTEWSEEEQKNSNDFKDKGNAFFKESKYDQAIDLYTEAIFCKISPVKKAIIYCNRSLANLRMENSSIALFGK